MKGRPLIVFTVSWIVGSSCAYVYSGLQLLMMWGGITLLLAAPLIIRKDFLKTAVLIWVALTLSGSYWELRDARNVTMLPAYLHQETSQLDSLMVQAKGVIASAVEVDGDRADFEVVLREANREDTKAGQDEQNPRLSERVMVQVKLQGKDQQQTAGKWQRGDQIQLSGELGMPATARNFDSFDYGKYLRTQEIHWLLKVKGAQNVQTSAPPSWNLSHIFRWNDQARSSLGAKIDQIFREPHAGYMKGLIIGMQDDLDPETYMQFSQLGLTHILAISGMHVAVYVASLLYILSLCRISREKSLSIVIMLVPVYVLLSGVSPSVVRAGIMSMIGLYAARRGMLKDGLNILSAAALLMLLWNPYYLLSVSFQLSFLVTAGLMLYIPLIHPLLSFVPQKLAGAVGVTLIAQLVSFPLTIYYFNQFSLLSFAANFVLVPFITFLVLPLGATALMLGSLWLPGGRLLASAAEVMDNVSFWFVRWMNGYPQFVTIWRSPSLMWIAVYFILLYLLLYLGKKWADGHIAAPAGPDDTIELERAIVTRKPNPFAQRRAARISAAVGAIMIGFIFLLYWGYQTEDLHGAGMVQFLDVGQGDSILITTPEGRHILVDGGGTVSFRKPGDAWKDRRKPFEVGAKVLVPLLKKRGIHHLDAVIVTHGDQDHAGGFQAVLEQIPVKAFLFNGTLTGTAAFDKLLATAVGRQVPIYALHQGMQLKPDKHTEMTFLSPLMSQQEQEILPLVKDQNHSSVVFLLSMNKGRFLFTGDMDKAAEESILQMIDSGSLFQGPQEAQSPLLRDAASLTAPIDVIKIAHHGSKTASSSDWLELWQPKAAVISAGVNNLYGHPHADVVKRISEAGAEMFRTDLQGEIQFQVKAGNIRIRYKLLTKS